MNTNLTRKNEEILELFRNLKTKQQIADLLEIPYSTLIYLLYRPDRPTPYTRFEIKKKSGGTREILAPISTLKILQRKLSYVLYLIYRPRYSVYGFAKGKSIIGNASLHTKKKLVLNLDLEDFFPSIHIGRVRGLFMAKPFGFSKEIATVLAQICCHEGKLPQGAPTSPVIANMICAGLDKELQMLAKESHCVYTRYADDISFSTTARKFSDDILIVSKAGVQCGEKLTAIIQNNGFQINKSKVRLQTPDGRQEVTGLTINRFPNVRRKYIRSIRSMLHAWRRYGEEAAGKAYYSSFRRKHTAPDTEPADFRSVVRGKLSFLKSVRGDKDPIYRKLLNKYNKIVDPNSIDLPVGLLDELKASLWIVKTASGYNGTAFMLKDKGLITCAHVVGLDGVTEVTHWMTGKTCKASVKIKHQTSDLAVLDLEDNNLNYASLSRSKMGTVKERDVVTTAGFPSYQVGDTPQCFDMKVSAKAGDPTNGTGIYVERFTVDKVLFGGMSGSPVVNENNEVVAVATYGSSTVKEATRVWDYGITPIYHLDNMA